MTRERATELIAIYGRAWVTRDPELITTIFTNDATYNDPYEPENCGRDAIRQYWVTKVIGEQRDITFEVKNIWLDGDSVIAEWYATFTDIKRNLKIGLTEVAVFTTREGLFSSLREYYKSTKTPISE